MKLYAVAFISFMDNENRMYVVQAAGPRHAQMKVLESEGWTLEEDDLRRFIELGDEDFKQEVFNGDAAISEAVQNLENIEDSEEMREEFERIYLLSQSNLSDDDHDMRRLIENFHRKYWS